LTGDLTGTERRVVMYGCDGQMWAETQRALATGLVADGEVCMVLERAREGSWDAEFTLPAAGPEYFDEEAELAKIPGYQNEAESFNWAIAATALTFIGLFAAGFS